MGVGWRSCAAIYDTNAGGTDAGVPAFTREPLERQRFERQATASLCANLDLTLRQTGPFGRNARRPAGFPRPGEIQAR